MPKRGPFKRVFLVALLLLLVSSVFAPPVLAFDGQPPDDPTPVPQQAPARSAPPWLGFILVFLLPFAYMIITSLGKKEPGLQPPGADLPVFRDGERPFKPYHDEDEEQERRTG